MFLATIFVVLTGCENFLTKTPSDEVSSSIFFTQEKDLLYAVNAVYSTVDYRGGQNDMRIENCTDNAIDIHSWNQCYNLGNGTATSYDGYVENRWDNRYIAIQAVNRILEGADGVTDIDAAFKARLIAEAKFFRAYCYLDLIYLFGDVPFITSSVTPDEALKCTRDDGDDILDSMIVDIDNIYEDLPLSYSGTDIGRVTRGAALTLKARILLYQQKWSESAAAAKAVMDLGVYSIYPNYATLFDYSGIQNEEVILDYQAMQGVSQGETYLINYGTQSVGCWSCSTPLQSLVDDYECTDGLTINESPLYNYLHPWNNRDPRLTYTILYPGHDWQDGVYNSIPGATYPGKTIVPGDDLTDGVGEQWNKSYTGYNWLKYVSQTDIDNSDFRDSGIHFILMRYAEVLLMYAEAKTEANDIDQSVYDALNLIRNRSDVNMPDIESGKTQAQLRTIIRRERRVELAFEGLRLFDIRRWKIAEDVIPGVPEGLSYYVNGEKITMSYGTRIFDPAKHYLWPIPQNEVDVTDLEQNPNW